MDTSTITNFKDAASDLELSLSDVTFLAMQKREDRWVGMVHFTYDPRLVNDVTDYFSKFNIDLDEQWQHQTSVDPLAITKVHVISMPIDKWPLLT
jgi:predicted transposase YbfD/YdcC